jgi:hypothetical protein
MGKLRSCNYHASFSRRAENQTRVLESHTFQNISNAHHLPGSKSISEQLTKNAVKTQKKKSPLTKRNEKN